MGYTVVYNNIGKGVAIDGSTMQTFYGDDFNPTQFDRPDSRTTITATNETTSFDLVNFQQGHEVGCAVTQIEFDSDYSGYLWGDFERYSGGGWDYDWYYGWDIDSASGQGFYMYFGVDDDEIRPGYTKYRIHYNSADGVIDFYSPEFTVSNLSFDNSLHDSGYMRVEGSHLCYTDGTHGSRGYKHIIAYDGSYSASVGSSNAGHIWLDEGDNLRIYYVDRNGYRRRTYSSDSRYGGNRNVGSSNKGYMWSSDGSDAIDGYGHLCFVAPNGSKRRILNGPPVGYT